VTGAGAILGRSSFRGANSICGRGTSAGSSARARFCSRKKELEQRWEWTVQARRVLLAGRTASARGPASGDSGRPVPQDRRKAASSLAKAATASLISAGPQLSLIARLNCVSMVWFALGQGNCRLRSPVYSGALHG